MKAKRRNPRLLQQLRKRSFDQTAFFALVLAIVGVWSIYFASAAELVPGEYGSVEIFQASSINSARTSAGLGTLKPIECIRTVARDWSNYMAAVGNLAHNPNFAQLIISRCGLPAGGWALGENVGVYPSISDTSQLKSASDQLFQAFMNSPPHKDNILYHDFTRVGVGATIGADGRLWVTQNFAYCATCNSLAWNDDARPPGDPIPPSDTAVTALLRNSNTAGIADLTVKYGDKNLGDKPIACDWDSNRTVTVGVFRNGVFYFRNTNTSSGAFDGSFGYGNSGDTPLCGDWNGDGYKTIGVYRPNNRSFYLSNNNSTTAAVIPFGNSGDIPLVGDWDGNGTTSIGVYRPNNAIFYLSNNNQAAQYSFGFGNLGDNPVTGDWNGDRQTTIGVFRKGTYFLRNTNSGGGANLTFNYGITSDKPLVGDWDGNGTTTVGVWR